MKVEISDQVLAYVKGLPPAPRRNVRLSLRKLENLKGDIRSLEGPLSDYQRLRVGSHRIVFRVQTSDQGPVIRCVFAQHRSIVYRLMETMMPG
ncbi:MAG: hypothetical protein PF795_06405 [Kiritimatiellae bacterium]|jgi:mRNA-degrading endonuclease RelE of RelBE toxin-antitoxin system|nr:hypothetical protein [Kiritimatiellia bacterium]